jgi:hypothetical protein
MLLLLATTMSAESFAPLAVRHGLKLPATTPRISTLSSTIGCHPLVSASTTQMWAVQDDDDDENENQNANTPTKKEFVVPQVIRDVGNAIDLFWTYTITVLGVALSFGLLLNFFGYAYIIDPEVGFRVDTIQELRKEKQFRAEANRLSSPQPPSTLPK